MVFTFTAIVISPVDFPVEAELPETVSDVSENQVVLSKLLLVATQDVIPLAEKYNVAEK
ncbi:hypothetical protein VPR01S_10_00020 [Vibrio proteolyticus NBRC 13287]|uniref:Uncharacterized protein n=1 Tax=Vibrio proteolyticus NBRC 13287 TaxID=1219065 RepID=U3A3B5_VIBPR|nr:hypothetical protein VPR01S_10_00020 [Vibrio proteolyticus NBRC 13287]